MAVVRETLNLIATLLSVGSIAGLICVVFLMFRLERGNAATQVARREE